MELASKIKESFNAGKKRRENMISAAIQASYEMLTIKKFIEVTEFKLNDILPFDLLWNSFHQDIPIYITDDLIKRFGYRGELYKQKENLMKLIKKYSIPIIQLNNEKYAEFWHTSERGPNNLADQTESKEFDIEEFYPEITKAQLKSKPLHTLIMPQDIKKLWLLVNTEKGDLIREYVISLDALFNLYWEYQTYYKSRQLTIKDKKIDELLVKMDNLTNTLQDMKLEQEVQTEALGEVVSSQIILQTKLDRATDERAPKTKSITKHCQFILVELNATLTSWQYYVIRAQRVAAKQALTKIQEKYPDSIIKLKINYQPNAVNLYNLIKEELRNKRKVIKAASNYIKLASDYSKDQFLIDVEKINEDKKDV